MQFGVLVLITHLLADGQVLIWTQDVHGSLKLTDIYQKVGCSGDLDPGSSVPLWSRVLLDKLIVPNIVMKYEASGSQKNRTQDRNLRACTHNFAIGCLGRRVPHQLLSWGNSYHPGHYQQNKFTFLCVYE